jgi:hypothetical protein
MGLATVTVIDVLLVWHGEDPRFDPQNVASRATASEPPDHTTVCNEVNSTDWRLEKPIAVGHFPFSGDCDWEADGVVVSDMNEGRKARKHLDKRSPAVYRKRRSPRADQDNSAGHGRIGVP